MSFSPKHFFSLFNFLASPSNFSSPTSDQSQPGLGKWSKKVGSRRQNGGEKDKNF